MEIFINMLFLFVFLFKPPAEEIGRYFSLLHTRGCSRNLARLLTIGVGSERRVLIAYPNFSC